MLLELTKSYKYKYKFFVRKLNNKNDTYVAVNTSKHYTFFLAANNFSLLLKFMLTCDMKTNK